MAVSASDDRLVTPEWLQACGFVPARDGDSGPHEWRLRDPETGRILLTVEGDDDEWQSCIAYPGLPGLTDPWPFGVACRAVVRHLALAAGVVLADRGVASSEGGRRPLSEWRKQVVGYLRSHGPASRADIRAATGVPAGSLSVLLNDPEHFAPAGYGLWANAARPAGGEG